LQVGLWFGIGLAATGRFLNNINILSRNTSKAQSTFEEYKKLVAIIEDASFESSYLNKLRAPLMGAGVKTSELLISFAKMLSSLDQRNNMLFGILGNGFLLWDIRCSYNIEDWIAKHGADVEAWFEAIATFDAQVSLGTFVFNHPHYVLPEIKAGAPDVLSSIGAGHPLIDPAKSVGNPIQIGKEQFHIITGANMAGKSTYLRTVSLQIVMANVGLPVCAEQCVYAPIKLITSMRSTDSLSDDTSYFFSELKRLRYIVDRLAEDRYFIILDEILKGTNSTDKAIGSRKFVKRLVASGSTGIIATHDLSLCELGDELAQVENYYLDAEIIDDELSFDYSLKKGICQNMNASFLLEKMDLV
jgi:DNA mismatch repair ATPase MutS